MAGESHLLTDLRLSLRHSEFRPVYEVSTERLWVANSRRFFEDLGTVTGRDNLAQAIITRLLTPMGELALLGHPEYGSRLHELIGERNTETRRSLVKLYILESLKKEPRIGRVIDVSVGPVEGERTAVNVMLAVQPVGETVTVTIGPFTLELEQ